MKNAKVLLPMYLGSIKKDKKPIKKEAKLHMT